jgi:hypothetical protein
VPSQLHTPYAREPRTAVHCPPRPTQTATTTRKGFACVAGCAIMCEYLVSTLGHPISTLGVPREYPWAPYQHPGSTLPVAARARGSLRTAAAGESSPESGYPRVKVPREYAVAGSTL